MRYTCITETSNVCIIIILGVLSTVSSFHEGRRYNFNYFVRCTRRFTPGLCMEPVVPVWTFTFHLQNCTERYGCPQDWRTNRFTDFARCMKRCKPLLDFYTELLSRDPQNLSAYIAAQRWSKSGRRDSGDDVDSTDLQDEEYDTSTVGGNLKGPPPNPLEDDPVDRHDWAVTGDIDDANLEGKASGVLYDDSNN